jgi:hypothetical protein
MKFKHAYRIGMPGQDFFSTIRTTLLAGFTSLPLILICISGVLGTVTANMGLFMLFLGQILLIPFVQVILSGLRIPLIRTLGLSSSSAFTQDMCAISPSLSKTDSAPVVSYWLANVVFFFSYLITNAFILYDAKIPDGADKNKVENRKSQTITSGVVALIVAILFIGLHASWIGCDTPGSLALGVIVFSLLGYSWHMFAEVCGIQQSDLFGIATQMSSGSNAENPYACVNINAVPLKLFNCGTTIGRRNIPDIFDYLKKTYRDEYNNTLKLSLIFNNNQMSIANGVSGVDETTHQKTRILTSPTTSLAADLTNINAALSTIQVSKSVDNKIIVSPTESYNIEYHP